MSDNSMLMAVSTVGALMMAVFALFVRMKAAKKPTNVKKIILPPVFMSTGFLMFTVPMFRVTPAEILEAFSVGMLFSLFLIKTSKFEVRDNQIYLQRSKAFIFILVGLLLLRIILKSILGHYISLGQTSGMFFILAFGMILPWRVAMLYSYKKLEKTLPENKRL
ncbi:CcdC family protein [Schinkia azotoformans]|nr:cytochrome c biogenesis protein CcdC [Schinkia azotoformans]MEC1638152.1 cytochrome c biogenesis protein CcdC [Schinkia azotoformans]MEC1697277.1 cytochrome c biogenesis protein CcdC [Schinkia azotoformans]MEC1714622.1 cytochrome c biogenesis protein CcdC [Schinkia azotoformans]MEC1721960.1 cytochrome c biogenesis protein CcdC [Schinkia azotoformans]MEC1724316.1 cytochrome c biogenesis protein CcdC [Schinkia azotoformans]